MLQINNLNLPINYVDNDIFNILNEKYNIISRDINSFSLFKRSIDARKKTDVHYVISILLNVKNEDKYLKLSDIFLYEEPIYSFNQVKKQPKDPIIVVGFGPCGMFCALTLARMGLKPIVIERGKDVDSRANDVKRFFEQGTLDTESNVQFGEGGAGTFSDGKLTTGVKNYYLRHILNEFVSFGAPKSILYEQKPHIGTDNLVKIVANIREKIKSLGGQILFNHKLTGIEHDNNNVNAVVVDINGMQKRIPTQNVVLAIGHSARDTYKMLYDSNIPMQQKPFSIGVRIEHIQSKISESQYGKFYKDLPPADYKLFEKVDGRGVYTFCNCPGGVVVASSSENGMLCVNGMSYSNREKMNANSALLVDVNTSDFDSSHALAGVEFQRKYEKLAFIEGYKARCQLVGDFIENKKSVATRIVQPSYPCGFVMDDVSVALPNFATSAIRKALPLMNKKLSGFCDHDAILTAVETRSSAPLRVTRDANFQSSISGIFPAGEGCGYAGGIVSSSLDGIKIAQAIALKYN